MTVQIDADIRELMNAAQMRRRAAAERVKAGEIIHLNFLGPNECYERALVNLQQLEPKTDGEAMMALADVVNYGLAVVEKTTAALEQE